MSNNHQPLFSDEELLTMYLFGHLQGHTTERRIYNYTRHHWREWFPAMLAYQAFNRRLNELAPAFELLIEQILMSALWQIQPTDDRLMDSVPMIRARATRANRGRVAPELADTGFYATKQMHYRGVKLHFIPARRSQRPSLPERIHLSKASQHDLAALRALSPQMPAGSGLFADKAYCHAATEAEFKEQSSFWVGFIQTSTKRCGNQRADALQSFRLSDSPATGKFVQLADSNNRCTERFARSFKSGIESALLCQTRRRLFIAHFLLLISIYNVGTWSVDFNDFSFSGLRFLSRRGKICEYLLNPNIERIEFPQPLNKISFYS